MPFSLHPNEYTPPTFDLDIIIPPPSPYTSAPIVLDLLDDIDNATLFIVDAGGETSYLPGTSQPSMAGAAPPPPATTGVGEPAPPSTTGVGVPAIPATPIQATSPGSAQPTTPGLAQTTSPGPALPSSPDPTILASVGGTPDGLPSLHRVQCKYKSNRVIFTIILLKVFFVRYQVVWS